MTFDEYWTQLARANPALKQPRRMMTLTVSSFRTQVSKAFTAGREDAKRAANDFADVGTNPFSKILAMFRK